MVRREELLLYVIYHFFLINELEILKNIFFWQPHAGYTYSGETAAWAYRQISPAIVKRIFILGPSHHVRLRKCALSVCKKYKTPLYDLKIDAGIVAELDATKEFQWMDMKTDEDEHSIEMHLPYIAKVMEEFKDQFTIVPGISDFFLFIYIILNGIIFLLQF